MILKELEACVCDVNRKMKIPDPSVRALWAYLYLPFLFEGSRILLNDDHQEWLYEAVSDASDSSEVGDSDIVPKLLYECTGGSKYGKAFHKACDAKGPTVTIVRCTNGYIFGGYNPGSWTSYGGHKRAENAFLFSLVNPVGAPPMKYKVKNPDRAVYNHPDSGPCFGLGDLVCWNDYHCVSFIRFPRCI